LFNFDYFLKIDNLSPVRFAHLRRKEHKEKLFSFLLRGKRREYRKGKLGVLRASAVKGFWEKIFFDCESKIMNKVYD